MSLRNAAREFADLTISRRVADRFVVSAKVKHPDVVAGIIDYLKTSGFKSYFKIKSARGGQIVLTPVGLNDQVDRVEITDLAGDKARFVIYLKNGDSGWDWDEFRLPPQFHNTANGNIIHLDRIKNPKVDPGMFNGQAEGLFKDLTKKVQRSGWVVDRDLGKPLPFAAWQEANAKREKARAEAEVERQNVIKRRQEEQEAAEKARQKDESDQVWSVVTLGRNHGYATEVEVFSSKEKAEAEARDLGDCYVVKGTQMWNEPLGQVEEHDRPAPTKYFRR